MGNVNDGNEEEEHHNEECDVPEKKMIPALDIKSLETVDALTFSIILHDDCLLNVYDIVDE